MKTTLASLLAIASVSSYEVDEPFELNEFSTYHSSLGWKLDAFDLKQAHGQPIVGGGTSPTFEQTDAALYFQMDPTLMYSDPAVPDKGITLNFCMGGYWFYKEYLDKIQFKCHLDGHLVYVHGFDYGADVQFSWDYCIPFVVPGFAPTDTYYITITGKPRTKLQDDFFVIEAVFSLF